MKLLVILVVDIILNYCMIIYKILMSGLTIQFNGRPIINGQVIDLLRVQRQPIVQYHPKKNKLYTIVMYDPDAPSSMAPNKRDWLHYLVINNDPSVHQILLWVVVLIGIISVYLNKNDRLMYHQLGVISSIFNNLSNNIICLPLRTSCI
jgi:hypothetical protein